LAVSQRTALAGLNTDETVQRTSVTAATALAFADGRFALGHPISSGFAIVDTHKTLPDSDISIGSSNATHAVSGLFGPALISDLSPYGPTSITYDVSNLPTGYDLGNGAFDLYPSYKSGYRLTVGSDHTVAAVGWLTDSEGKSITLLTGTAYEEKKPDGRKVSVFTNRNGKFSAQGLCPGRWILDMATTPSTRFVLDIPEDTVGIVKLGTLKPVEGTP
jgi:outer membrane usher protein